MTDRAGLPPLHLQLAGPAARPSGHPDHAFVLDRAGDRRVSDPGGRRLAARARRRQRRRLAAGRRRPRPQGPCRCDALRARLRRVGIRFPRIPVPDGDARRAARAPRRERSRCCAELLAARRARLSALQRRPQSRADGRDRLSARPPRPDPRRRLRSWSRRDGRACRTCALLLGALRGRATRSDARWRGRKGTPAVSSACEPGCPGDGVRASRAVGASGDSLNSSQ